MSSILPFASETHPVWTPFAAEIHAVVRDRMVLEKVRSLVCQWARHFQHACDERNRELEAWRRDSERQDQVLREIDEHWSESSGLPPQDGYRSLPPSIRRNTPAPVPPELPLPLSHRELTAAERWAVLSAIYDAYWMGGEKINPWPEPADRQDLKAYTAWVTKGALNYKNLLERVCNMAKVGKKKAKAARKIFASWLKDATSEAKEPPGDFANTQARESARGGKGRKPPRVTVETKMTALVIKDPATHNWSCRKFAKKLGCSHSAVFATKVFKTLETAREMARLKRSEEAGHKSLGKKADRSRKSKPRSAWDKGTRD